ncbi:unnamed protein product [Arctogadus glacialis]
MFDDVNMNIVLPRRTRKDPSSPGASESFSSRPKKLKLVPNKCASIILQCRSVRVGTLRRMVTKPVVGLMGDEEERSGPLTEGRTVDRGPERRGGEEERSGAPEGRSAVLYLQQERFYS